MFTRNVVAASSIALMIGVASLGMSAPAPVKDTLPAVQLVGHDSKIMTPRFVLVHDQAAWDALWAEHNGVDVQHGAMARHAAPKIDFAHFMVVGAFAGATTNTDGQEALSVISSEDSVRVRFVASTFQTSGGLGGKADQGIATSPFGLWIIHASNTSVVLEEGRRGVKDSPMSWHEVKRFDPK